MKWLKCLLLMGLCVLSSTLYANAMIEQLRMWPAPDDTRLVFDLSASVQYQLFKLSNPERLVIDISHTKPSPSFVAHMNKVRDRSGFFRAIRVGIRNGHNTRLVLDLNKPVISKTFLLKPSGQYGYRLVVDLRDKQKKPKRAVVKQEKHHRQIVIAVDPGHGGEDPGAIGGLAHEKTIVFHIATYLAAMLNKQPGFKAILTRTGDYYVSLRGRTQIARKAHADFFVSVHADAFTNHRAKGPSVYALSQRGATSEAGRWLAQKENAADLIGGVGAVSLDDKDAVLAGVLLDLSMTATLNTSIKVGRDVLNAIAKLNDPHKSRVEQAAFVVLKSPDIPSILVETGFITNPTDRKKLRQIPYQKQMAQAIMGGVVRYFKERPPTGTWLAARTKTRQYLVRRGDTLSDIAKSQGVTMQKIKALNRLKTDQVRIGQTLLMPNKVY